MIHVEIAIFYYTAGSGITQNVYVCFRTRFASFVALRAAMTLARATTLAATPVATPFATEGPLNTFVDFIYKL